MLDTLPHLLETDFPEIKRSVTDTLQVNLGYVCNQQCLHCHVNAGPNRKESMSAETVTQILSLLSSGAFNTLDITGGAPELNESFRYLVEHASTLGIHVMDRCNLTILNEPGQESLGEFLAAHHVEIVASMPCYLEDNVNGQRGKGVYQSSIEALKKLNELGYGQQNTGLELNLVYNPTGPYLPPAQQQLEADYHRELGGKHGIVFNQLYTITNMPIARFGSTLLSKGEFESYMHLLKDAYSTDNTATVMCKNILSVDWQGYLYDCDFNQMLNLPMKIAGKQKTHIKELDVNKLEGNQVVIADHCYGCTAGQGSSCGGALS